MTTYHIFSIFRRKKKHLKFDKNKCRNYLFVDQQWNICNPFFLASSNSNWVYINYWWFIITVLKPNSLESIFFDRISKFYINFEFVCSPAKFGLSHQRIWVALVGNSKNLCWIPAQNEMKYTGHSFWNINLNFNRYRPIRENWKIPCR